MKNHAGTFTLWTTSSFIRNSPDCSLLAALTDHSHTGTRTLVEWLRSLRGLMIPSLPPASTTMVTSLPTHPDTTGPKGTSSTILPRSLASLYAPALKSVFLGFNSVTRNRLLTLSNLLVYRKWNTKCKGGRSPNGPACYFRAVGYLSLKKKKHFMSLFYGLCSKCYWKIGQVLTLD